MSLPRSSDAAAKQALDSTRVFKEYARVRKEAKRLDGSLFWKRVGFYEYLVHKLQGKVTYLGPRSEQTEGQLEKFKHDKAKIEQRARSLKESVATCQRMNKAVRAGSVPTPIVDVLLQLEEAGLAEGSTVLGTSALFAYGQPAGVRLDKIALQPRASVVETAEYQLQVLLLAPEQTFKSALRELRGVARTKVEAAFAGGSGDRSYFLLAFHFGEPKGASPSSTKDSAWRTLATRMAPEIDQVGKYEQVVIGKTGAMATMRTLDPQFFALMNHAVSRVHPSTLHDPEMVRSQAELVDSLISEHLVVTKLPEAECRQTADDIAQRAFAVH